MNKQLKPTDNDERTIKYQPAGSDVAIELTIERVRRFLCTPTKSGKLPSDEDVVRFMMLCRAKGLDPWVSDAYLIGYDAKDGPQFSLITSVQALHKRAEMSEQFAGIDGGIIVCNDGEIIERPGELRHPGDDVIGAWSVVLRKDRDLPVAVKINRAAYDKGFGMWKTDPCGMVVKCAKAKALREAFPNQCGDLYTRDEVGAVESSQVSNAREEPAKVADLFLGGERAPDKPQDAATERQQGKPARGKDAPAGTAQKMLADVAPDASEA